MSGTQPTEPTNNINPVAWASLALAVIVWIVTMHFFNLAGTKVEAENACVFGGLTGLASLIIGISSLQRAKVLRRGRGVAIAAVAISGFTSLGILAPINYAARESLKKEGTARLAGRVVPAFLYRGEDPDAALVTNASLKGSAYVLAFSLTLDELQTLS
ncbi:MAG: hypothetical protein WBP69_05115, partial [Terriglobales bacterium]